MSYYTNLIFGKNSIKLNEEKDSEAMEKNLGNKGLKEEKKSKSSKFKGKPGNKKKRKRSLNKSY